MMDFVKQINYLKARPLLTLIIIASLFRVLAVIFSQGYGFHDDHFVVIEPAQSWVDGTDYNDWLPESQLQVRPDREPKPQGHSFLYVGTHYLVLNFLDGVGITSPKSKMYFIRFIHALFSLLIIIFGYKLTERISDKKNAFEVGLLLSLFWFMPFFSVRNLVEFVCIPFMFLSNCYLQLNNDYNKIPINLKTINQL